MASDQEFLSVSWFQYLGSALVGLWVTFFGMQQRKINQMVTREDFDEAIENAEKTFTMRREAVEHRLDEHDRRFEDARQDLQSVEKRLIDEIRHSELRLIQAFRTNNGER